MKPSRELERTFAALADPTRLGVVGLLRSGPRRAGDLAQALEQSPPAMSRHLRVLRRAGLIADEAHDGDARVRLFRLRRERLDALEAWLAEVRSFWSEQLEAFAEHVRARKGSDAKRR